jgi:hypothetical protein
MTQTANFDRPSATTFPGQTITRFLGEQNRAAHRTRQTISVVSSDTTAAAAVIAAAVATPVLSLQPMGGRKRKPDLTREHPS